MLGARASAWHSEVFSHLPSDIAVTVVATTGPRYPLEDIASRVVRLRGENEVGGWLSRRLSGLRWRLDPELRARGFPLVDADGVLGEFDVLHSWELFTEWTRLALEEKARRGVPLALTVWDTVPRHFAREQRRGTIRRAALAAADAFYVVSDRSQAALELDGVDSERIVAARPSVDAERFHPGPGDSTRVALGAARDECLVIAVARLVKEKGLGYLVDAVALARRRKARLRLVIFGSGPEEASLRAQVGELGLGESIGFAGERPYRELHEIYRAADVFVLPSLPVDDWQEQWGQSLLEAMASGVACVASRSGAIPEVLGDAGLMVAPADSLELGAALHRLAGELKLRDELGRRARARVEAAFTHQHQASALTALYSRLASGRSHA